MYISKDDLIREVAKYGGVKISTVRTCFNALEDVLLEYLSSASPTKDIKIKVVNGLDIESKYVRNIHTENPKTKEKMITNKIRVKSKITQHFTRKINNEF